MASSPVQAQLKTRATGYIGSRFVGVPGTTPAPPAAPPATSPMPTHTNNAVSTPQVQPNQAILDGHTNNVQAPTGQPPAPAYVGTPANSNVQGFDPTKLANPDLGVSNKYQGGRYLQQHPGDVNGLVRQPGFEGWTVVGPDKVRGPGGSVYDVRNANGAVQWTAISGPAHDRNGIPGVNSLGVSSSMAHDGIRGNYAAANAAASDAAAAAGQSRQGYAGAGGSGGGAPAAGAPVSPAAGAPASPASGGAFQDQLRALLMQQLQGATAPVDERDPAIAGEMAMQTRLAERTRQERRAAAAERMAAEGLNSGGAGSGALDQEIASGYEDKGHQLSDVQSQLVGREVQNRRAQALSLMNMALQTGDNEQVRALQLRIAQMDDQLRRLGLTQQQGFHDDQYGLSLAEAQRQRDLDAARARAGLQF